jgi:hypothetical protein
MSGEPINITTPQLETCSFIPASRLVPTDWIRWFWEAISENAPFSWGDNNRSMVTASCFALHCEDAATERAEDEGVPSEDWIAFMEMLYGLGETYIDLEN